MAELMGTTFLELWAALTLIVIVVSIIVALRIRRAADLAAIPSPHGDESGERFLRIGVIPQPNQV